MKSFKIFFEESEIESLEALIANPDPSRVKMYGGGTITPRKPTMGGQTTQLGIVLYGFRMTKVFTVSLKSVRLTQNFYRRW